MSDNNIESEEELFKNVEEEQLRESLLWDKAINFVTDSAIEV